MRKIVLTFVSLVLVSVCAFADRIDDWRRDQTAIEALLQQKRYAEARKASIKLTNHMLDRLGADAQASTLLARTVALRAAAEDGLGNVDDTNWYRQVATLLDPQVAMPAMRTPLPAAILFMEQSDVTTKPEVTRRRPPERPGVVNALGVGVGVVRVVIDVDGAVRQPSIVSSPAPSVAYATLESAKQWRFRPATKDGKAVATSFTLTITMH
jgi:hypothetical protein